MNQDQFIPELAAEVLRLFPVDKYENVIHKASNEAEVKDIFEFLLSFAKCALNKNSVLLKTNKKNTTSNNNESYVGLRSSMPTIASTTTTTDGIAMEIENGGGRNSTNNSPSKINKIQDKYMAVDDLFRDSDDEDDDQDYSPTKQKKKSNSNNDGDDLDEDDDDDDKMKVNKSNTSYNDEDDDDNSISTNNKNKTKDNDIDNNDNNTEEEVPIEDEEDDAILTQLKIKFQKLAHSTSSHNQFYQKYKNNQKLREFIELFTIPASEFGDGIVHNYKIEPPPTCEELPDTIAEKYIDVKYLKSKEIIRRVITNIIAIEYSQEPNIRKLTRQVFITDGSISTRPTKKGLSAITAYSELFGLHYLNHKPIRDFLYGNNKTLFAELFEAERNGLITIAIHPPEGRLSTHTPSDMNTANNENNAANIYTKTVELFLGQYKFFHFFMPSESVQTDPHTASRLKWDELRMQILNLMLEKYLFPSLLKEMKRELIKTSREAIINEMTSNYTKLLHIGAFPYPAITNTREFWKNKLLETPQASKFHTVMGVNVISGEPICCCYMDSSAVLKAHMLIPKLLTPAQVNDKLRQFLLANKPQLIVINASGGMAAKNMLRVIESMILPEIVEIIEKEHEDMKKRKKYGYSDNYAEYNNNNNDEDEDEDDEEDNDDEYDNDDGNKGKPKKKRTPYQPIVSIDCIYHYSYIYIFISYLIVSVFNTNYFYFDDKLYCFYIYLYKSIYLSYFILLSLFFNYSDVGRCL